MEKQIEKFINQYRKEIDLLDEEIASLQNRKADIRSYYNKKGLGSLSYMEDEAWKELSIDMDKAKARRQSLVQFCADLDSLLAYV